MDTVTDTRDLQLPIAGRPLRLLVPANPERLLDDPAVHARFDSDEYMPYWAEVWPAAIVFANYLLEEAAVSDSALRGAARGEDAVLELGAGVGLVGLALAAAGWRVILTDYDADALKLAAASAIANGFQLAAVRELDWRTAPDETYPIIIGAEVLYERRSHEPVAKFIAQCLDRAGVAYLADACRAVADVFPDIAATAGLKCETIRRPVSPQGPGVFAGPLTEFRMFRLTHR
jgi:predicted nicotinamide N-methyase